MNYESDELFETDEFYGESDEAWRPRGRLMPRQSPLATPGRGNAVPPRPQAGFATHAELTATANRLDAKIATLSDSVSKADGRIRAVETEQGKLRADLQKEWRERRGIGERVNNLQQMAMILPLLTSQQTKVPAAGSRIPTELGLGPNDKIVVDSGDNLSKMLPLLMFSTMGTGSSGSSASGGMDNSALMMLAVMMATNK